MAINPWLQAIRPVVPALRSGRVPDIRQFPIPGNMLLRRFGGTLDSNPTYEEEIPPEEELPLPPIPPERETVAPATTTNAGGAARPQNQGDESQETFDALREFQANLRAQHMTTQPQQLSVLDMLRKRMARDAEAEPLQRLAEFGQGMMASGSPNFFTMLAAGGRAAREGDISRTEQLRRLADLERQDAAQRAEEARRVEELRIREAEQRLMAPYRAALTEQALASAAAQRAGRTGATNAAALRRATQAGDSALNAAIRAAAAEVPPRTLSPDAQEEIWQRAYQRSIQGQGATAPAGAPSAPATTTQDIPTITPLNRPAR